MRILAIDIGTGTQDILLFDSALKLENCPKLVMPSATSIIAKQVEAATRGGEVVLLTGVTMGGGPCAWAVEAHLKAGHKAYATPEAARTFDDHLENVEAMGIRVVSEDEAPKTATRIVMQDVDLPAVSRALEAFNVTPEYDGIAIAVFDHGAAPKDVSDRTFRFNHLRWAVSNDNHLGSFAHMANEVPDYMTRMKSVAQTVGDQERLLLLDTAPAGAIGALDDPSVAGTQDRLLVNLGNMHATAFRLEGDRVYGLFEHHTGLVDPPKLERLLDRLMEGRIENGEVFDDHGHGAHVFKALKGRPLIAVTGPQRAMLRESPLAPHFASPHGDMMLSGCFGLVRAFGYKVPEWREEIEARLRN